MNPIAYAHTESNLPTNNETMSVPSKNINNKSDHTKKEEFRMYLEQSGVLEALTKLLVGLYEEPRRPTHAMEYMARNMASPDNVDMEGLRRENAELKIELEQLRRQLRLAEARNTSVVSEVVGNDGNGVPSTDTGRSGQKSTTRSPNSQGKPTGTSESLS